MEKRFDIIDSKNSIKCLMYCNNPHNFNTVVISCHGFAGSKENNTTKKLAETILDKYKNLSILTFDWPAHGEDVKQKLRLSDCNDYLNSVIKYVKEELKVDNILLQATSFGGYLVLKYINENTNPFKKIAFRCPAINMYDILINKTITEEELNKINKGKIVLVGYRRKIKIDKEIIEELKENDITKLDFIDESEKMLIVQGTEDELVDYNIVEQFAEDNIIEFKSVEGADHRFNSPAEIRKYIDYVEELYKDEIK